MKTTQCPSCGAPVTIRAADSLYVVCAFCRSTLLRDGEYLKNLGHIADLIADPTLIQIGTEGKYRGRRFSVIGRLQLKYESGLWNEWHLFFDDGSGGWLSEAGGEYAVSFLTPINGKLPGFSSLKPEKNIRIGERMFMVTNLESATCISGEGELPFSFKTGYYVPSVDLRSVDGSRGFATIDYSEAPPLLFVGETIRLGDLELTRLRDKPTGVIIKSKAFNCLGCGAPLMIHSAAIERIVCPNCGRFIGVENDTVKLLEGAAVKANKFKPTLPLGSSGILDGVRWEIIGFMQRSAKPSDPSYAWFEYLLFNEKEGFSWLAEYSGHWNFARALSQPLNVLRRQPAFSFKGEKYRLFASDQVKVTYVIGEFYWKVAVGDNCLVEDYICPPKMLSREVTSKEVNWSQSLYLEPKTLYAAFNIKKRPISRTVIFSNQPNPYKKDQSKILRLFLILAAIATAIQLFFIVFEPAAMLQKVNVQFISTESEKPLLLPEFSLKSSARMLQIKHQTDLNNNWIEITATLVNKDTGEHRQGTSAVSYYHGRDSDGAWSEGSRHETMSFRHVPAGYYYLMIEHEKGVFEVNDTISVIRSPRLWSNYILCMIALLFFPVTSLFKNLGFEKKRWEESDYSPFPSISTGDDDD
jgi:ribosomal protein S27E